LRNKRAISFYTVIFDDRRGDRVGHENIAIAIGWWGWGGFL